MLEVADILRLHGESFRKKHPALSPHIFKVLRNVEHCRTAYFGGHLSQCDRCGHQHYSYHSCGNRHCPKCNGEQTSQWLDKQRTRLLGCPYFFLTFTLPAELRSLAYAHPKEIYSALLNAAAASVQKLAWDPQWVGGKLAILAVLHTWTRAMLFHPHGHLLVSAGGLSKTGDWMAVKHPKFLIPGFALSKIFRAKFKAALKRLKLLGGLTPAVWKKKWVVHCQHAGSGQKVLDYLGRYAFRIAINNNRLKKLENGEVTFSYRDNRTQHLHHVTIPAEQFIERFSRHILPKGFVKVRSYGLWNARSRLLLEKAQASVPPPPPSPESTEDNTVLPSISPPADRCPKCKEGHLIFIRKILPQRIRPP
jgi:hypothetical protein